MTSALANTNGAGTGGADAPDVVVEEDDDVEANRGSTLFTFFASLPLQEARIPASIATPSTALTCGCRDYFPGGV
jgi:hypothetical protein